MKIWLVTSGEIIPTRGERPHRVGMLSSILESRGHSLVWWTTTFDHQSKEYLFNDETVIKKSDSYLQIFLHSSWSYSKNISWRRIVNHWEVGRKFYEKSKGQETPDIILCSFPTIDLSYWSVRYGLNHGIPVIVDIRDLWPDIISDSVSNYIRPVVKALLHSYYKKTRYVLKYATSLTAVSRDYLVWGLNYADRVQRADDAVFPLGYFEQKKIENVQKLCDEYYSKIGVSTDKVTLWFVGTFGQTYDMITILKAVQDMAANITSGIQIIISGDGEKNIEWRREAGSLDNVIFTGWVNAEHLNYISRLADIGLMAYKKNAPQGLPNKIYEYMASGLAILSSLQNETEEILEKYDIGYTYEAGNVEDCKLMISNIINNEKDRNLMKARSRKLFDEKYSAKEIYNDFANYIEAAAQ